MTMDYRQDPARSSNVPGGAPEDEAQIRCFVVFVGGEPLGLCVEYVQTIFGIDAVTPVPLGPREIIGLVNLRGKIVTAVSLRRRLDLPDPADTRSMLAVGMDYRGENFALVVDEVGDVLHLSPQSRISLPPHLNDRRAKFTKAAYRLETGILSLLDVAAIFDFPRHA
jgi:purine-binding chemotaxis protein CheW